MIRAICGVIPSGGIRWACVAAGCERRARGRALAPGRIRTSHRVPHSCTGTIAIVPLHRDPYKPGAAVGRYARSTKINWATRMGIDLIVVSRNEEAVDSYRQNLYNQRLGKRPEAPEVGRG